MFVDDIRSTFLISESTLQELTVKACLLRKRSVISAFHHCNLPMTGVKALKKSSISRSSFSPLKTVVQSGFLVLFISVIKLE